MESTATNSQQLVKRYNEFARRFKVLYAVSRHYPNMGMELEPDDLNPPTDLNSIYGRLNVLRKMLETPDPAQITALLNEIDQQLGLCWRWFEGVDRKLTPYLLRTYCEKNQQELSMDHLLFLAQFLLNKIERIEVDQGKIDYLLTQCFCIAGENGIPRLRVASEQALKDELIKLLPEHLKYDQPGMAMTLTQCDAFLHQLMMVSSFEDLISSDYINRGRQLKNAFGPYFYNASVLAKCVQINTVMRQKFAQLYNVENQKIRQFSEVLINTGTDIVQIGQNSGDITAESAKEFSEKSDTLLNSDYGDNNERLRTFVRIREMLDKTIAFYGLDPNHVSETPVDRNALDEERLSNRISERRRKLRDQLLSMPERPSASVQILELEKSRLVLSSWEKEALLRGESGDADMRLSCDLLARSASIIAEINEAYASYRSQPSSTQASHIADTQLMTVNYFIMQAHQSADELEQLSNRMREQGRIERACDLSATRHKLLDTCWKIKV
jgi:hypothetical protein